MRINPFKSDGQWYRGNTHSHSTESDGQLSMKERFDAYRERNYDFLVLTDHRIVNDVSNFSTDDFLAISGSEVHPSNPYGGDTYHIVAINIHEPINCSVMHPNDVIKDIKNQGGEAVLCHPYWCGHNLLDYLPLEDYFAIEVYNDTCMGIGKGFSEQAWDDLLDKAGMVYGIAADDSHGVEHDCFHAWINVKASSLTTQGIMDALRNGAFYSTLGPEIYDLDLIDNEEDPTKRGKKIVIKCEPVESITFKSQRSRGRHITAVNGKLLTEAEYLIPNSAKYVRVEVTRPDGKKAWTNPFYLS